MTKVDLLKEWFAKANNDILNMENNLNAQQVPTDTICFHAQQTVEKYLKGWLSFNDIEKLNDFAVKVRYPFFMMPTIEATKESYQMALKVKEFVLKKVKL